MQGKQVSIGCKLNDIDFIQKQIESYMNDNLQQYKQMNYLPIVISVKEILTNIIKYGEFKPYRSHSIDVQWQMVDDNNLLINIADSATPFNPLAHNRYVNLMSTKYERKKGGLGIFLVKKVMTKINYSYTQGRNTLEMLYKMVPASQIVADEAVCS